MSLQADDSAVSAYLQAISSGADRETALDVALAKFRARFPLANEWEIRVNLAKALAAERVQAARTADDLTASSGDGLPKSAARSLAGIDSTGAGDGAPPRDHGRSRSRLVDAARMPLRVLIVEDEALTALDFSAILEEAGAVVLGTVPSASEAEGLAKALDPDVILMDVRLTRPKDGIDAAEAITRFSKARVVFVTGNTEGTTRERIRAFNGTKAVTKPVNPEEIVAAIAASLAN